MEDDWNNAAIERWVDRWSIEGSNHRMKGLGVQVCWTLAHVTGKGWMNNNVFGSAEDWCQHEMMRIGQPPGAC